MAANANPWWVITFTSYGNPPTYEYFQGTQSQATAKSHQAVEVSSKPNLSGPYATKADAEAAVKGEKVNVPNTAPDTNPVSVVTGAANNVNDFINLVSAASTWVRVLKVVIGGTLLIVGIAHMTGAGNAIAITARKVPLPI